MEILIGREVEKKLLQEAMDSENPELIALFGRKRVGKTFLIRQYLKNYLTFEFVSTRDAKLSDQLENFKKALGTSIGNDKLYQMPESWPNAFEQLSNYLTSKLENKKSVVFLDEFPWLSTHKSGFLSAFDHWWNSWDNKQKKLVVIICGSAASWMIQNIMNNKGGLHNRITRKIRLLPFNLQETEKFLLALQVNLDRYQILQIYMVMGGIPHYLKEVKKGERSAQTIDGYVLLKMAYLKVNLKTYTILFLMILHDTCRLSGLWMAIMRDSPAMKLLTKQA